MVMELTYAQQGQVRAYGKTELGELDLASLLRVFERNWYALEKWSGLPQEVRTLSRNVTDLRHAHAHSAAIGVPPSFADNYRDLDTLNKFVTTIGAPAEAISAIRASRLEALEALAADSLPNTEVKKADPLPELPPTSDEQLPEAMSEPDSEHDSLDKEAEPKPDLAARAIGQFRIYGPEDSIETETTSFNGRYVAVSEIPWRVTGPGGLEFKVHILLIDDPDDDQEIGQVSCDSRLGSPQRWDEVVRRLRTGIRRTAEGALFMDMRAALPKENDQASRRTIPLDELDARIGIDVRSSLIRLGAQGVGTRNELTGETNRTRESLCVTFDHGDALTPVAAWVVATLAPLI